MHTISSPFTVVLIVPTGIGAAIGGYAGDALPVARAMAQVADCLITHPNVLNGAQMYWPMKNVLYVEGYGLDQFAAGQWGLTPVRQNRIGLVLDQGIEEDLKLRHLQAADAARATLGLSLTDYVVTDMPLGVELRTAQSGATWGTIQNPDSLLRSVDKLIRTAGAEAIAVVARFPDDEDDQALENYRHGHGVDPLAGAEAVISHLVVKTFQIPCAHAPALSVLPIDPHLSPRAAAEELGYTFLPCVLAGLSYAPQFRPLKQTVGKRHSQYPHNVSTRRATTPILPEHVDAVVVPESSCGGSAVLSFVETDTQIITVADNQTTMQVSSRQLNLTSINVQSYLEALGVLVAQKSGVSLASLRPHIAPIVALS
ncbi:MAG: DUF3326 domain-containing protein [Cyanobacteria bacterium P01_F01_bin.150]